MVVVLSPEALEEDQGTQSLRTLSMLRKTSLPEGGDFAALGGEIFESSFARARLLFFLVLSLFSRPARSCNR